MARKKGRKKSLRFKLKKDTWMSILIVLMWFIAALIIVSFSKQGVILRTLNDSLLENFGFASMFLPFLFLSGGFMLSQMNWKVARPNVFFGGIIVFVGMLGLLRGGSIGLEIFQNLAKLIHVVGAALFYLTIIIIGIMVVTETAIGELLAVVTNFFGAFAKVTPSFSKPGFKSSGEMTIKGADRSAMEMNDDAHAPAAAVKVMDKRPKVDEKIENQTANELSHSIVTAADPNKKSLWQQPPASLLGKSGGGKADRGDLNKNASIIESLLDSFGIKAKVVEVNCGPAVTQYALEISMGTKLSKITALQNDLALALAAPTGQIRIEAPIPGRSMVGIEIPNRSPEFVTMRTMLLSPEMKAKKSPLAVALGLNVSGEPVVVDIASMPHVLIAGATGSGKSVCMNTIMASILFRSSPEQVKFILVDPKRVELTQYNDIPHLLAPVIVEPQKASAALKWAVTEMNERYKTFAEVGVRNIEAYNEMSGFQAVPYIVIMIDELADLMLASPKETEQSIIKLAQMARAVGIHLVLATQRPSVDVLTGLIKANVPTRVAFNVSSMVDSRVILDSAGAEKLLGKGDMLYIGPGASKSVRVQGTFVSDREINDLISFIKNTGVQPQYTEEVTSKFASPSITSADGQQLDDVDDKFSEALELIVRENKASASMLQRHLSVGYSRAARMIDQMEAAGVISRGEGNSSKPRQVLISSAQEFLQKK